MMNEAPTSSELPYTIATALFFHFHEKSGKKKGSKESSRFLWIIPNKQSVQTAFWETEYKYAYIRRHEYEYVWLAEKKVEKNALNPRMINKKLLENKFLSHNSQMKKRIS